jgi:hypothetical protein
MRPNILGGVSFFFCGGLVEYHMDVRSENGVPQDPLRLFNQEHEGIGVAYSQSLEFIIASRAPHAPRAPRWKFFGQLGLDRLATLRSPKPCDASTDLGRSAGATDEPQLATH